MNILWQLVFLIVTNIFDRMRKGLPKTDFMNRSRIFSRGVVTDCADGSRRIALASSSRRLSFAGAGALIAVGYMDPGNWATSLAAGAQDGYALLTVVLLASLIGVQMQWLASRVGLVTGRDLAQLARGRYGRRTVLLLWMTSEIAIIACDIAEVIGCAVALQLLMDVSLVTGVVFSAVGTFAMLALKRPGSRKLEATVLGLIIFVALCFLLQLVLADPDWHAVFGGFVPSPALLRNAGVLWLAAGILGATVMPHNLYLHSWLVKDLTPLRDQVAIRQTLRSINLDTFCSLTMAFIINAALLIVAAAVFHDSGNTEIHDLADAQRLLTPLLGNHWAGPLFAAALLACGLNSTVTGTLAGQVVMQGFWTLNIPPWQRAFLTRMLAIGPALVAVGVYGQHGTTHLLVASQIVLSLQLPLVAIPLTCFAADHSLMGQWHIGGLTRFLAWASVSLIIGLNAVLIWKMSGAS